MDTSKIDGPVVYVGPNLPGLSRHAVFSGGMLPHVRAMLARSAALRELVVPLYKLNEARSEVARKGSLLNTCAETVTAEFNR